jgi:histidyl-tRNA synthetase
VVCRCRACPSRLNNRKLIQGFYQGLGIPDVTAAIRQIDKLDKLAPEAVAELIVENARCHRERPNAASSWRRSGSSDHTLVQRVQGAPASTTELLSRGLVELSAVLEGCADAVPRSGGGVSVEANLRIARGLDYYTGTVVEIFMVGYERLKAVGGGGRYDALASDGRTTYPGVGISFGLSRTLVPLISEGVLAGSRAVPSAVLVALSRRREPPGQRARGRQTPQPRHLLRGRAQRAEVRPPDPVRRAPRHPVRLVPRDRDRGERPGEGHPIRRPGRRGHRDLDTTGG